jgi:hypothetical protein
MAFKDLFKDDNHINEKSVVGFASFAVMVLFAFADLISGAMGQQLVINEVIYNSFVWVTLGCFGIAEVSKTFGGKSTKITE